jgi:hypothetical protein
MEKTLTPFLTHPLSPSLSAGGQGRRTLLMILELFHTLKDFKVPPCAAVLQHREGFRVGTKWLIPLTML